MRDLLNLDQVPPHSFSMQPDAVIWQSHDPFGSRFITNACNQMHG